MTELIPALRSGDSVAFELVYEQVYSELRRLAHVVRGSRNEWTLNTTGLVHEAYLRLVRSDNLLVNDRVHFLRVAARAMRQVLVNLARQRSAEKRGGGDRTVTFVEEAYKDPVDLEKILELEDAISRLERMDSRMAQIVECRFFAGLSVQETATALNISPATVKRDWRAARAWLTQAMTE